MGCRSGIYPLSRITVKDLYSNLVTFKSCHFLVLQLFPARIGEGYCLHRFVHSDRLRITTRQIRLKRNRDSYQMRPDTVMPYMVGTLDGSTTHTPIFPQFDGQLIILHFHRSSPRLSSWIYGCDDFACLACVIST